MAYIVENTSDQNAPAYTWWGPYDTREEAESALQIIRKREPKAYIREA